ncbi:MAG TPA: hypothetical protein VM367_06235 [Pseudonocardia sp.]|jgi:hypothetical protein|nr:hypothetical protein [Pseudonocardia sp.]
MPPIVYVTSHIHVDGPIPGPHSLLTLAATAHLESGAGGGPISTFRVNVRELPGATPHPVSLRTWRERPDDWLTTRRGSRPPAVAMSAFTRWISGLPGEPTFVADPVDADYPFLYWYLQRFTGRWPFARHRTDTDLHAALTRATGCPLSGCRIPAPVLARTS